ncbi:hypothetical protein M569_10256 [Genlisea aurea]|uniref:Uncharacterized protein n=1 Tax=Genlisea aurea TaxID=192259 RepID=S8DX47_9LAMI|nr:hypothetical protein M569_10256 [Genlisea aurea]
MSSEAYDKVRAGRLTFKGGDLATRDKVIGKKKKKKIKNKAPEGDGADSVDPAASVVDSSPGSSDIYTIDAAKKMKYEELFPVEAKKFKYDPKAKTRSVEEALDDRVTKKADRYCK